MRHLFILNRIPLIYVISLFLPAFLVAQVTTTFDTADSLENWRAVGDGNFYFEAGNGNPGNAMRVDDDATGNLLFAVAPGKFLGDWRNATPSDSLTADIFLHRIGGSAFTPDWVFRISGPGGQAIALQGSEFSPPSDEWTHFAVALDSTQWTVEEGNWQDLMEHVTMLEILTEYITGDEYVRLDNPALSFTPEVSDVAPPIYSEFDDGSWEGWSFVNTGGVSIENSAGNPDGFMRISDKSDVLSEAIASSVYLGSWADLTDAAAVQMDLKIISHSGNLQTNHPLIELSGPGGRATIPLDSSILAADEKWVSYSFLLNASVWTVQEGTWNGLMNNVTNISVFTEFFDGSEVIGLDNFRLSNDPPQTAFTVDKPFVFIGDTVQFHDQSVFAPHDWSWAFGDGSMSNEQHPNHYYDTPGLYDVSLTTENSFGTDNLEKKNFIEVAGISDSILFFDDFENDTIHPAWSFVNGGWTETGGIMRQTTNYYKNGYINGSYAIAGSPLWSDYTLAADIYSTDNDKIGMVFRYQDAQNFYLFTWQRQGDRRYIKRFVDGQEVNLAADSVAYETNTWYHVQLVTEQTQIKCYVDSVLIFEVTDSTFATGKAGLYCHGNDESHWDNFSIVQTNYDPTDIAQSPVQQTAQSMQLYQNYPNPFNPSTQIRFYLPQAANTVLNIYNVLGQRVKTYQPGKLSRGDHVFNWQGNDQQGQPVASGLYFYELRNGPTRQVKKMFLLR
ncbi:MAG: PKD domain-containing protein [Caldithrix sp.]|nr:PKD domain-containing protein [Caldithrix sp.]